jgi:hypothetical protein
VGATVLMRALRQPRQGKPSLLARVIALLLVVGLVATVSPAVIRAARWLVVEFTEVAF